jgi:hypothetical protein
MTRRDPKRRNPDREMRHISGIGGPARGQCRQLTTYSRQVSFN